MNPNEKVIAVISYDPLGADGEEWGIGFTPLATEFMATLNDFELKVFAAEAGVVVRHAFELPPSPSKKEAA